MKKLIVACFALAAVSCASSGEVFYLIVGSYADETAPGIYVYKFDAGNGNLDCVSRTGGIANPSFLALSSNGKHVYSVSETDDDRASVQAFRFEEGSLTHLNTQLTGGAAPCHVSIDPEGRFIVTANYTGGSVTVFPLAADGSIVEASQIFKFDDSTKSHLHCTTFSPDGRFLFATDLGTDKIYRFRVENEGNEYLSLDSFVELNRGSGTRHLVFHPSGKYAYAINELAGTVTSMQYVDDRLIPFQYSVSDTTAGGGGKGSADIHVSPDGKFLYSSNRLKADGIAIFSVDENSGALTRIGYQSTGAHPRNFALSPDGRLVLVASRDRNNIEQFKRNAETGLLESSGTTIEISKPVCLIFDH